MGKLGNIGKLLIRINGNDHHPAHFHVVGPDADAQVTIDPVVILRGNLTASVRSQILAWAVENHDRLVEEWNRCNPHLPISRGRDE